MIEFQLNRLNTNIDIYSFFFISIFNSSPGHLLFLFFFSYFTCFLRNRQLSIFWIVESLHFTVNCLSNSNQIIFSIFLFWFSPILHPNGINSDDPCRPSQPSHFSSRKYWSGLSELLLTILTNFQIIKPWSWILDQQWKKGNFSLKILELACLFLGQE